MSQLQQLPQPKIDLFDARKAAKVGTVAGRSRAVGSINSRSSMPSIHTDKFYTIEMTNFPATFYQNNNTSFSFDIPTVRPPRISQMIMKIKVLNSSASSVLAPTVYWHKRVTLSGKSENSDVQTFYPEPHLLNLIAECDQGDLDNVLEDLNFRPGKHHGETTQVEAGEYRTFYLNFAGVLTDYSPVNWQFSEVPLVIKFDSQVCKVSGSGTVTVVSASLIFPTEEFKDPQDLAVIASQRGLPNVMNYIEPIKLGEESKTVTAGDNFKIDLGNLGYGHYSALLFGWRPSGYLDTTSNASQYLSRIPDDTIVDIQGPGGDSRWAENVDVGLLRKKVYPNHFANDYFQKSTNMVLLPFCRDIRRAIKGEVCGSFELKPNEKYFLYVRHPAAATTGVYNVACSATGLNNGTVRFKVGNDFSAPISYNALPASIYGALNAMPVSKDFEGTKLSWLCTASFTGSNVGLSVGPVGVKLPDSHWPQAFVLGSAGGTGDNSSATTLTTPPVPGCVPGTYQVFVAGLRYNSATEVNGVFKKNTSFAVM